LPIKDGRSLGALDPNDILEVSIVSNSDDEYGLNKFNITLSESTESHLIFFMNFSDPQNISRYAEEDQIKVRIKKPQFFVS